MTLEEVRERINRIKEAKERDDDDEKAHWMEDELHQDVLRTLSESSSLAKEALKTLEIDFSRWCA